MDDRRHNVVVRCRVASELVGHEPRWLAALAFEKLAKELLRGTPIAPRLNQDVDEIAILVDGAPEILALAADGDEDLVEVQNVAEPAAVLFELRSVTQTELPAPLTNRLVGDHDSALGQQIFDVAEA